jgi:large subunit ribosomal protein L24
MAVCCENRCSSILKIIKMKQKFSTHWKASKQPRKQRKYTANAPLHIKRKLLGVNLSKELRKKYSKRNIPVRKGDEIRVMRGKFKGKQGKIISIDTKSSKIKIDSIMIKKQDGSKVNVRVHPSNLQIITLNTEDKKRIKTMNKEKIEKKTVEEKIK